MTQPTEPTHEQRWNKVDYMTIPVIVLSCLGLVYMAWVAFIAHCVRMAYRMGLLP